MEELLSKLVGHKIDVVCYGASSLRGEVVTAEGGVLQLKDDEDQICHVAIDKIIAVWKSGTKNAIRVLCSRASHGPSYKKNAAGDYSPAAFSFPNVVYLR